MVKESLTDAVAVAAGQHVERVQLLIAPRPVPVVLRSWTVPDEPHDPALAPGDANPPPGIISGEQTRPHHTATLALGVIVKALREQPAVGFPPRPNMDRSQLLSVIEARHDNLEVSGCHSGMLPRRWAALHRQGPQPGLAIRDESHGPNMDPPAIADSTVGSRRQDGRLRR